MAIDVSKFHQTFFDESLEGLEAMESGLLELEEDSSDNEAINTIFRAAHSIKGGAGTLGFSAISEFTHHVETILDRRRAGRGEVTQETIDVLLSSVDCLRDMLSSAQFGEDIDAERVAEVEGRLQHLVDSDPAEDDEDGGSPDPAPATGGEAESAATEDDAAGAEGWQITFAPHPDMFRTGNDPVRILGELATLGQYEVRAEVADIPGVDDIDVEVCYASWVIELRPDEGQPAIERSAIDEVFEWVEDDADIEIVALGDETAAPGDGSSGQASGEGSGDTAQTTADGAATPPTDAPTPPAPPAGETRAERRSGGDRRQDKGGSQHASIRVDIDKVDSLINMVGELVITQSMLQQLANSGDEVDLDRLREGLAELDGNTRELQGNVMQIRMLPISFAFSRLPRLVRDLASKLDKSIELEIHGETTELDKTVMEKIGDPLVHLVRNSLDHGIEMPADRAAAGKPETGTIVLSAYHEGGNIVIEISDDGGGISSDKILAKARERGLVGDDEQLSDKQIHDLIFHPGLSTAEQVSDISGRGVGMDVVKRNIKDLGGAIEVVSEVGVGTTFRIRLPPTLAILDGQLVRVGDQVFIIPLIAIVESLQFDQTLTSALAAGAAVYRHRDVIIPLIDLSETLDVRSRRPRSSEPLLVVVESDGRRVGLIVDDLLGQQQIVIKSLTTNFRAVAGLSGATILGDGTVAMIVDVNSVVGLFRRKQASVGSNDTSPASGPGTGSEPQGEVEAAQAESLGAEPAAVAAGAPTGEVVDEPTTAAISDQVV
jgi:two-component system chemotaxis sensor kinase CheA